MHYNPPMPVAREKLDAYMRQGMTLLELLMVLTILAAIVFVAIPTLRPVKATSMEAFARERLRFIAEREQAYFLRNGNYDRFSVLTARENGGPFLDSRFATDDYRERGIIFTGPQDKSDKLLLEAQLPDGTRIMLNEKGEFKVAAPSGSGDLIPNPQDIAPEIPRIGGEQPAQPAQPGPQPQPQPRLKPGGGGGEPPPELPMPGG